MDSCTQQRKKVNLPHDADADKLLHNKNVLPFIPIWMNQILQSSVYYLCFIFKGFQIQISAWRPAIMMFFGAVPVLPATTTAFCILYNSVMALPFDAL